VTDPRGNELNRRALADPAVVRRVGNGEVQRRIVIPRMVSIVVG
jgi:hypothetical protein